MSQFQDDINHKETLAQGLNKAIDEVEKLQALTRVHVEVMNAFYPRYNEHKAKWKNIKSNEIEQWSAEGVKFEAALKALQKRETELSFQVLDKQKETEQWRIAISDHNKELALRKFPDGPYKDQVRRHIEMR